MWQMEMQRASSFPPTDGSSPQATSSSMKTPESKDILYRSGCRTRLLSSPRNSSIASRRFAILRCLRWTLPDLPFLELAATNEVEPGSELTLIGYPFSAESAYAPSVVTKFCLSTLVAATDTITHDRVKVDAIYFKAQLSAVARHKR